MNKKMKRKNQISKYYVFSSVEMIKKIQDQMMKKLLYLEED